MFPFHRQLPASCETVSLKAEQPDYNGVFAPHSAWRAQITPAGRGRRRPAAAHRSEPEKHRARHKAQRLKRVFRIDVETCDRCGGAMRIIASWTKKARSPILVYFR